MPDVASTDRTQDHNGLRDDEGDIRRAFVEEVSKAIADHNAERMLELAGHLHEADLGALLADQDSYFYVCGLKSMEEGVLLALRDVAQQAGLSWEVLGTALKLQGRLHLETY